MKDYLTNLLNNALKDLVESFDKDIEDISATKIRMAQDAIDGKYGI